MKVSIIAFNNLNKSPYVNTYADFCRDNGIEFAVIVTPHRTDYYDRFESFREESESVSSYLNDLT